MLHELVHTIQYDGHGTCPVWLTESIADLVRLQAHLGATHWRKPGMGKRDKGYEDGYDSGARFLEWLTGESIEKTEIQAHPSSLIESRMAFPDPTPTSGSAGPAATAIVPIDVEPKPYPAPGAPRKRRRTPIPDFVKRLDSRLLLENYSDHWWKEITGADLETLWAEYMDYYA